MYPRKQVEVAEGRLGVPSGLKTGDRVQVTRVVHKRVIYLAMRRGMEPWYRIDGFPLNRPGKLSRAGSQMEEAVQWLQLLSANMLREFEVEKGHAHLFPPAARWELQTVQDIEGNPLPDIAPCIADAGTLKTNVMRSCESMWYDWVLHLEIVLRED